MLVVAEKEIGGLMTPEAAFEAVEAVFAAMASGKAYNFPVVREAIGHEDALYGFKGGFDGAALTLLKAWNTGHPGGIATVHANSASSALYRIEQLIQEAVVTVPRRLVAEAINLIVFIAGRGTARRIETIACVAGLDPDGGYAVVDLSPTPDHTGD